MNIQRHVSTMEQSETLKALGVSQDAFFSWCGDRTHIPTEANPENKPWVWISHTIPANVQEEDHREDVPSAKPFASTFNVTELLQMLPDNISIRKEEGRFDVFLLRGRQNEEKVIGARSNGSLSEALATLLIAGIEKGLHGFDIQSINQRLTI